jgi:hypothetical protein
MRGLRGVSSVRIDTFSFDYWRNVFSQDFPDLKEGLTFEFTSPVDFNYNCLAWALSCDTLYSDRGQGCYWPWNDASEETADGWARVCEIHGFRSVPENDISFVLGIEKIAILQNEEGELHATRQNQNGKWKSKFGGQGPDIDHADLVSLRKTYGNEVRVLQRSRPDWPPSKSQPSAPSTV